MNEPQTKKKPIDVVGKLLARGRLFSSEVVPDHDPMRVVVTRIDISLENAIELTATLAIASAVISVSAGIVLGLLYAMVKIVTG